MSFYESIEEKYYGFMDALHLTNVFVRPIEERGIPSFPVFVLLLALVIGGAWFFLGGGFQPAPPAGGEFAVKVLDANAAPVADASVKVEAGEFSAYAKTNAAGVASFKGLPAGKDGKITVQKTGFDAVTKSFNAGDKSATLQFGAASPTGEPEEKKIVVTVMNSFGEELGGAALTYTDPATGETMVLNADATGRAEIFFENEEDFFNVRASLDGFKGAYKTCFASSGYCEIELTEDLQFCSGSECETEPDPEYPSAKGSVSVSVFNADGGRVSARVVLYDADSVDALSEGQASESGPALFEFAAELGASVYVNVFPDSEEYAAYYGGELNEVRSVEAETEFEVVLERTEFVPSTRIEYAVVDEDAQPVSGAVLSLYSLANPLRALSSTVTDEEGKASFEVASGIQAYLVASADGFLPFLDRSVEAGSAKTIVLTALAPGNNAVVRALVVDDENAPQSLASVFLVTIDGFYSGVPSMETGADGWAEFSGVPIDGEYGFRATLGARSGKSDFFVPAIEEEVNATVTLEPEVGTLSVSARDAASGELIAARFTAVIADSNSVYDACEAKASANYSCELIVKAGKSFTVKASAADYAPSESELIVLAPEERAERELLVIPLAASKELKILSFKIIPVSGAESGGANGGEAVDAKQLDRGRYYRALLTVNFPGGSGAASGAFLRVGDKQAAEDEAAVISFIESVEEGNASGGGNSTPKESVSWSNAWNPSEACASDLQQQEGGVEAGAKWVNWEYEGAFGVRTFAAKVFVKPTARSRDKIIVFYRAYSKRGSVVTRSPADGELGFEEKTKEKDWCRAETQSRSYSVVEGDSVCNGDACISVSFAFPQDGSGSSQGDGFKANTNSLFEARVAARSFTGESGAVLRVTAVDESLELRQWSFGKASGEAASGGEEAQEKQSIQIPLSYDAEGAAGGAVLVRAKLPSQQAVLKFALVEDGRVIAETQGYVVVEGLAKLVLSVAPSNLSVQKPATLTALVKRGDDGSPVEDARVSLVEDDEGNAVFEGAANGDKAIVGDASEEGRGAEGRYVFKRVLASLPGFFNVVVERKGFASETARVSVAAADFLEFSRDLTDLRVGCEPVSIEVSSALGLVVPVLASFNGVQCVSLRAPGLKQTSNNTWSFEVARGKSKKIEFEALRNGKCYLVFDSVLPSNGGVSSATAWITVNCSKLEPAASPTPKPSNCTSDNCGGCSEADCLALNESCEAKYARNPQGANVFVRCLQREKPKDKCDAAHCDLCNEEECNALFATKNCTPLYTAPANAWEAPVFANCTAYTAIDCSPAKFNLQNILARRLAQYHARSLLDPQVRRTRIGASAGTQIVYDMAGLRISRSGNGCTSDGALSASCEKKINAIVPTNAMAFSVYNQFGGIGADFKAQIKGGSANKCFRLERLDDAAPLDRISSLAADVGSALGVVPPMSSNTWLLRFVPKDGCVNYVWRDGGLYAEPAEEFDSITLSISPVSSTQYAADLTLRVVSNDDSEIAKYAFLFTPYKMAVDATGEGDVDAGFFVNNLQAGQKLVLKGAPTTETSETNPSDALAGESSYEVYSIGETEGEITIPSQSVGVTRVYYSEPSNGEGAGGGAEGSAAEGAQPVFKANAKIGVNAFAAVSPEVLELNPKAYEGDSALQCSDDKCCSDAEYVEAKKQLNAEAKRVFGLILQDVEEIYDGNIVDGNAQLFQRALNDALADYAGQQGAYLICKNLGMDPLEKIKNACAEKAREVNYLGQDYGTDLQTEGFGEVYGDSFVETACDSSVLNYAFGFGESMAPGGTFTSALENRLVGALTPRTGTYRKKNYIVPVDIALRAVLKRGGSRSGVELYVIRPKDVDSPDSSAATGDWISLEGPKPWTGLTYAQNLMSGATSGVNVITGCLAPYFGGVPDAQKLVSDRCKLNPGSSVSQLLGYCFEGVTPPVKTEPPATQPQTPPETQTPVNPPVGQQPSCDKIGDWCVYGDAAECWKNGKDNSDQSCFETLKTIVKAGVGAGILAGSLPTSIVPDNFASKDVTQDLLKGLFSKSPSSFDAKSLYLTFDQFKNFKSLSGWNSMPLCFKTWTYNEAQGKFYNNRNPSDWPKDIRELIPDPAAKQKWVCTTLWTVNDARSCVPLDDVFNADLFQPTQCLNGAGTGVIRCVGNQDRDSQAWQYECGKKGEKVKAG